MHHRIRTAIFAALTSAALAASAIDSRSFDLAHGWRPGDFATYRISSRRSESPGVPAKTLSSTSIAKVRVISASGNESVHEWNIRPDPMPSAAALPKSAEHLLDLVSNSRLVLRLNHDTSLLRLENAQEVRQLLKVLYGTAVAAGAKAANRPEAEQLLKDQLFQTLDDDRKLAMWTTRDLQHLYGAFGDSYTPSTRQQFESQIHTALSIEPLPAVTEISVSAVDPGSHTVQVVQVETLSPEGAVQLAKEMLREVSPKLGSQQLPPLQSFKTDVKRETTYLLAAGSVWPKSIKWRQTIVVEGQTNVESVELTLTSSGRAE